VFETSDLNPNVMIEIGVVLTWGKRVLPIKKLGCNRPPSDISGQTYADYKENGADFVSKTHSEDLLAMIERAIQKKSST
jgi:predicted nucleotide-binding protein